MLARWWPTGGSSSLGKPLKGCGRRPSAYLRQRSCALGAVAPTSRMVRSQLRFGSNGDLLRCTLTALAGFVYAVASLSKLASRLISRLVSRSSLKPGPPGEHHKRTSGIRPRSESCGVSGQAHQIPNSQPPSTGRRRQARSAGAARERQRRSAFASSAVLWCGRG